MRKPLYHQDMYRYDTPVPSYWESSHSVGQSSYGRLEGDVACDVAIIGGGFTGLNAAIRLARDFNLSVHVLEAGHIGWGASGRNGGFACQGAFKHSLSDVAKAHGEEVARELARWTTATVDHVDEVASRENLDIGRQGDGNFQVAHSPRIAAGLADDLAELTHFGIEAKTYSREEFAEIGHGGTEQFGALQEIKGFGLHPLKYVDGLARTAAKYGAVVHGKSEVLSWEKDGGMHLLRTAAGAVRAEKVLIACNGFMPEHLDDRLVGRVLPVISNIITTRPLTLAEREAQGFHTETPCYNMRNMLYYYRLLEDGRFLLGARGDSVGSEAASYGMRQAMTKGLYRAFPAWDGIKISHYWRGFVAFTRDFYPAMGQLDEDDTVFYSYAYHGNGVAAGSYGGYQVAGLIAGRPARDEGIPDLFRRKVPRVPFPGLRRMYVRVGAGLYALQDKVNE